MFVGFRKATLTCPSSLTRDIPTCIGCMSRYMSTTSESRKDMIGPPHKISNLRPIRFHISENETAIDKEFRLERQKVQQWNETFWVKHNSSFMKEIEEFRQKKLKVSADQKSLSAEEMSEFYKAFLDKNWRTHVSYNFEWYSKNFKLVLLALKVRINAFKNQLLNKK